MISTAKTRSVHLLAALSFFVLTGAAAAKQVDITISQGTFKSRCQEMGGTYTDHGGGKATCRLPNGQWATCDFLLNYCETSQREPSFLDGSVLPDRMTDSLPPESLTSSGSESAPGMVSGGTGSGSGKGAYAGGAGGGSSTLGGGGPTIK